MSDKMAISDPLDEVADVTIDALKQAFAVRLVQTDAETVLNETKEWFEETLGYTPLQAANMTRLVMHAVGQDYGRETYTKEELETIKSRIDEDF